MCHLGSTSWLDLWVHGGLNEISCVSLASRLEHKPEKGMAQTQLKITDATELKWPKSTEVIESIDDPIEMGSIHIHQC